MGDVDDKLLGMIPTVVVASIVTKQNRAIRPKRRKAKKINWRQH
jgi:hypothetical protein